MGVHEVPVLVDVSADDDRSTVVDLNGRLLVGIITPATLTSTAIKFETTVAGTDLSDAKPSGSSTWYPVYVNDGGTEYSVAASTSRALQIDPEKIPFRYIRLVMGSSEGDDRTLTLVLRDD